ncbi:unnamed protein product [Rangifer tarandus platyrhynchus]|uniref:MROH2B-like HEAT-repeats domain-containing protein n=1 Tax=Rangifer tarandus platyrhynchus TaxID=3082113 RepID=A0ABN8XV52_RANTA|nr:unnamed protein product [Rangifer tarandus platyrhynchus]
MEEPQERGAGVALLSAEHTEFTWNQKTWEDRLIQFLRNSLKMTLGSRWSLRLSKELNNQMESFDSPSLEKVGSQRQGLSPLCLIQLLAHDHCVCIFHH